MLRKTLCQVLSVTLFLVNICYAEPEFHTIEPTDISDENNTIATEQSVLTNEDDTDYSEENSYVVIDLNALEADSSEESNFVAVEWNVLATSNESSDSEENGFPITSMPASTDETSLSSSDESTSATTDFIAISADDEINSFKAVSLNDLYQYDGNIDFLNVAEKCHDYIREHDFYYSQGVELPLDRDNNRRVDCSSFVSWCISEYTNSAIYSHDSAWFLDTARRLKNGEKFTDERKGWRVITDHSNYRPGDIMCYKGHVHIYAGKDASGNHLAYNAGGNTTIAETITKLSDQYFNNSIYAIRIPKN